MIWQAKRSQMKAAADGWLFWRRRGDAAKAESNLARAKAKRDDANKFARKNNL